MDRPDETLINPGKRLAKTHFLFGDGCLLGRGSEREVEATSHFAGGLAGESDGRETLDRFESGPNDFDHPLDEGEGFACSRSGEDNDISVEIVANSIPGGLVDQSVSHVTIASGRSGLADARSSRSAGISCSPAQMGA